MPYRTKQDTARKMLFKKDKPMSGSDSLRTILESVGLPLLSGKDFQISSDLPYGWKSNLDLLKKELGLQKQFGKNYKFDINIKPDDYKFKLTYDMPKKSK